MHRDNNTNDSKGKNDWLMVHFINPSSKQQLVIILYIYYLFLLHLFTYYIINLKIIIGSFSKEVDNCTLSKKNQTTRNWIMNYLNVYRTRDFG